MLISTKGRYALRVMIDLSEQNQAAYIPLKEIAIRQNISEKYLEVIIKSLTKAHYVEGLRGKGGGYRLTRSPESYTVAEIIEATEGSLSPVDEIKGEAGTNEQNLQPMWEGLEKVIREYLEGITLLDLSTPAQTGDFYVI